MFFVNELFKNRIFLSEKLPDAGFIRVGSGQEGSVFRLERPIMDGELCAVVRLTDTPDGMKAEAAVYDRFSGEEYLPVFIDSFQGKYVGAVREELKGLLTEISDSCTKSAEERPPAWIIPANPKHYDIEKGFEESPDGTLLWTQRIKAQAGDTLFIYHTEPIASLTYRCTVVEADIPADPGEGDGFTRGRYLMRIRREERYPDGRYPRSFLNEHGIKKTVRGQRSCPDDLFRVISGLS